LNDAPFSNEFVFAIAIALHFNILTLAISSKYHLCPQ
jgi:hypothetical protein